MIVAVGVVVTTETARCVDPEGGVTFWAPLWANEATRRLPSPEGVIDGPWVKTVLRLYLPLLPSTGFAVLTPAYARTDPAAPVDTGNEKA